MCPQAVLSPVSVHAQVKGWSSPSRVTAQRRCVLSSANQPPSPQLEGAAELLGQRHADSERLFGAGSACRAVVLLCAASPEVGSSWDPALSPAFPRSFPSLVLLCCANPEPLICGALWLGALFIEGKSSS